MASFVYSFRICSLTLVSAKIIKNALGTKANARRDVFKNSNEPTKTLDQWVDEQQAAGLLPMPENKFAHNTNKDNCVSCAQPEDEDAGFSLFWSTLFLLYLRNFFVVAGTKVIQPKKRRTPPNSRWRSPSNTFCLPRIVFSPLLGCELG